MRFASWLMLCVVCAPVFAANTTSELEEGLETYFAHCHEYGLFNGTVLVKQGGEVVYERALGAADLRDGRALDLDSAFYLASVSKQFTSMAAMMLVDEEKLSLDSPLTDTFPEFAGFGEGVLVRHLMTHTSGIPDHYQLLQAAPAGLTNERVLEVLVEHGALDFAPGTQWAYSNGGYVLLSMLVARAAGQSFRDFMQERIFTPLGMTRTQVVDSSSPALTNRALGFGADGALDDYELFTTGAGGMYTTVGDLSRWDDALASGELVSERLMQLAFTQALLEDGSRTQYGFGWFVHDDGRRVWHSGGLNGFGTMLFRDRSSGDTLIVLCNQRAASLGMFDFAEAIGALLAGVQPALPDIPVAGELRTLISTQGVEAALARYDVIRQSEAERYDLSEEQLNTLGYEYAQSGELDIALALLAKNCEVFPDAANTWDSLGEIQLLQGEREQALQSYTRSLELNPDNSHAVEVVGELTAGG
ncbi:MAG: hypothetical protein DRQ55_14755 [Planctomycetota bacterium]|nr:MAG: hypothetical protein DRQ55_14755 [Planctomycetota bacterium]